MAPTATTVPPSVSELRERVARLEGRPMAQPVATHPALRGLMQLQSGSVYAVESASLVMALMAGPSADGAWCAVVGTSTFGLEAAAAAGVDLSRTVLVPDPGDAWLEVTAALIDVLGVVVVVPPGEVAAKDAARVAARLRQRGGILIAQGDWPRAEARLTLADVVWGGVGRGHGHLRTRQASVELRRGTAPARTVRLWLPDADQCIRPVGDEAAAPALRSVG